VASHELVLLLPILPLLMFPVSILPFAGLALAGLVWGCRWIDRGRPSISTHLDGANVILAGMTLVGLAVSVDPALSSSKVWGLALGFIVFYAVANGLRGQDRIIQGGRLLGGLALLLAVASFFGTDWGSVRLVDLPALYDRLPTLIRGVPGSGVPRASDLFHPRQVGAMMGLCLPVFAALLWGRGSRLRLAALLVCLVTGSVMLLTQSAQAILGAAVGVALALIWRWRWALLLIPLVAVAAGWGAAQVGPDRLRNTFFSEDNAIGIAVVLRLDMWSRALAMLGDRPLTGIGINTFPTIQSAFYPGYAIGPEPHAHNQYLQTALDLGVPGLFAWVWLIGAFYVAVWRRLSVRTPAGDDPTYRALMAGLACGVTSFLIHGLFDAVTLGAKPIFLLWAMFGLVSASPQPPAPSARGRTWWGALLMPLLLTGIGVLVIGWGSPAMYRVNRSLVEAHRLLWTPAGAPAPSPERLTQARAALIDALTAEPANQQATLLLARTHLWGGDAAGAVAFYRRASALEAATPLLVYRPSERWRRGSAEGSKGDQLTLIYSQWQARFPDQAEQTIRVVLVVADYLGDTARARNLIQNAISRGAQPASALAEVETVGGLDSR
jgi:hypothetical protein